MREYATLSQASYDHASDAPSRDYEEYGWQVVGGGDGVVTFQRAGDDGVPQYAVAFKGTSLSGPTTASDLANDALILAGGETNPEGVGNFDENTDFVKRFTNEVAGGNAGQVTITGHSLGGTYAMQASKATGSKAIVYNPGVSPLSVADYYSDPGLSDIQIYRVAGDPVSTSAALLKPSGHIQSHTIHKWHPPTTSAHALSNFLD